MNVSLLVTFVVIAGSLLPFLDIGPTQNSWVCANDHVTHQFIFLGGMATIVSMSRGLPIPKIMCPTNLVPLGKGPL